MPAGLDPWAVRAARDLVRGRHATVAELARDYGVSERMMQRLVYGQSYRNVPGALPSGRKPIRRLTEAEAREILADHRPSPKVAERYGVAESTVRHIRTGRIWRHLTTEATP